MTKTKRRKPGGSAVRNLPNGKVERSLYLDFDFKETLERMAAADDRSFNSEVIHLLKRGIEVSGGA